MEHELNRTVDALPALAWTAFPDGRVEFVNRSWCEYTGLSPEQASDEGWQVAFHPDDRSGLLESWRAVVASGKAGEAEARMRRFDGTYRRFVCRASPIADLAGNVVMWCGVNTDIEDRKLAEERLRKSAALMARVEQLSSSGSFCWRPATGALTWSEQLYRIFGIEPGVPITMDMIAARFDSDDLNLLREAFERAREGKDLELDHRLRLPDGSVRYIHVQALATRDPQGWLDYIGTVRDMTEHRQSEEARLALRTELSHQSRVSDLGALTVSIAHEINQPLTGVITNASTGLRMLSAEPPNVEGALETVRRTIRDGRRASDVLAHMRLLFSKTPVTTDAVDLVEAAYEVIELLRDEIRNARIVLRMNTYDDLPPVTGDRLQLQQVVLNLLLNAIESMRGVNDRPRQMLVKIEPDDSHRVQLAVTDSGEGFDSQLAGKLADAFLASRTEDLGTGLLASRRIIESHGGRLWASANAGHGATFAFSIPRCADSMTAANRPVRADVEQSRGIL